MGFTFDLEHTIHFCHGDLELILNDGSIGWVSSQAKSKASPVWNKFINPPLGSLLPQFRFSFPCDDSYDTSVLDNGAFENPHQLISFDCFHIPPTPKLDFRIDDKPAMCVLLNIVHGLADKVDKKITEELLYNIAVLCEQYMCVEIVRPWLFQWYREPIRASRRRNYITPISQAQPAFVYYAFGLAEGLEDVAIQYMGSMERPKDAQVPCKEHEVPGFKEAAQGKRLEYIDAILQYLYNILDRLLVSKAPVDSIARKARQNMWPQPSECELSSERQARTLGHLMLTLVQGGLWPKIGPSEWKSSAFSLARIVRGIAFDLGQENSCQDDRCPFKDLFNVDAKINYESFTPVLDHHRQHMRGVNTRLQSE